jgi:hypothetical protein
MNGNALIKRHDASLASTRASLMIEENGKERNGFGCEGVGVRRVRLSRFFQSQ